RRWLESRPWGRVASSQWPVAVSSHWLLTTGFDLRELVTNLAGAGELAFGSVDLAAGRVEEDDGRYLLGGVDRPGALADRFMYVQLDDSEPVAELLRQPMHDGSRRERGCSSV